MVNPYPSTSPQFLVRARKRHFLPFLLTALFGSAAAAHQGATGIVLERMELMKSMENEMKALRRILLDEQPVEPGAVQVHAQTLHKASRGIATRFPMGSADPHSHALPAVWERPEEFRLLAARLDVSTEELLRLASASADRQQLIAATKAVGSVCQSCHELFKKPED